MTDIETDHGDPGEIFEFERLHEVCGDDRELESEFLKKLLASASESLSHIAAALGAGDTGRIHADAHSLKGVCLTLGASALGAVCGEIEQAARGGDLTPAQTLLARAESDLHALRGVLEPYLARLTAI